MQFLSREVRVCNFPFGINQNIRAQTSKVPPKRSLSEDDYKSYVFLLVRLDTTWI
jgi:hypothetical protein